MISGLSASTLGRSFPDTVNVPPFPGTHAESYARDAFLIRGLAEMAARGKIVAGKTTFYFFYFL